MCSVDSTEKFGTIFLLGYIAGIHYNFNNTSLFRYGREDEEVMGLKFCNEAVIALKQLWPKPADEVENLVPLQVSCC
jgi:hypothetical protein